MTATPRWVHVASLSQLTPGKPKLVHAETQHGQQHHAEARAEEPAVHRRERDHRCQPHRARPLAWSAMKAPETGVAV